jgi:DNA mismatch repair protein MutS2
MLIVTGPNTGGKTVSFKDRRSFDTDGTSRSAYSGIQDQVLDIFEEVFADIGDEQSMSRT